MEGMSKLGCVSNDYQGHEGGILVFSVYDILNKKRTLVKALKHNNCNNLQMSLATKGTAFS